MYISLVCVLIVTVVYSDAKSVQSESQAKIFLSTFGYLKNNGNRMSEQMISHDTLTKAISDYQNFMGINITGELDKETVEWMSRPRCGNKDKLVVSSRIKRYKLARGKWNKKDFSYTIDKYTPDLPREIVQNTIEKAFNMWASVTPLTFRQGRGPSDISISFEQDTHHGDNIPWEPEVLGHAATPGEFVHLNDQMRWTVNKPINYEQDGNLLLTATHEIGHSLGLEHSQRQEAIMFSSTTPSSMRNPTVRLHEDDIMGIQELYGRKHSDKGYGEKPLNGNSDFGDNSVDDEDIFGDKGVDNSFDDEDIFGDKGVDNSFDDEDTFGDRGVDNSFDDEDTFGDRGVDNSFDDEDTFGGRGVDNSFDDENTFGGRGVDNNDIDDTADNNLWPNWDEDWHI